MSTLSTTFGRGLAAAKPGSPRAGHHYFSTDTGVLERYSGSAWVLVAISGAGLLYKFSTTTTDADPGVGIMRWDNATPGSVTNLYLDDQSLRSTADLSTLFAAFAAGTRLLITQIDDTAKNILARVTSVTDGTGYYKLAVAIEASNTLPDNNAVCSLVIFPAGGGGASSVNWWDEPHVNVVSRIPLHDGDILGYYGQPAQLQSGTADGDGKTGAGGITELTVGCSCFYDISPSANAGRGWVIFDQDIRADNGHYCRVSGRFGVRDDQHHTVGWHSGNTDNNPDTKVTDGSAYFYCKETDTNWQAYSADGTAGETTDTGVAYAASGWHNFEIYVYNDGGTMTVKFWIDGTLVATHTTRAPQAATTLPQLTMRSHFITGGDTGSFDTVNFCNGVLWACQDSAVLSALGLATL